MEEPLYGGTYTLFKNTMVNWGIKVNFVDTHDLDAYREAINDKTKAIYCESVGNPQLDIPDFEAIAEIAHENGIPLIVDNTSAITMVRPIDYGADIVVHSATKFLSGTGTSMGGIIVDGGNFDWTNGKFPQFTEPDESYHGLIYSEAFGNKAYIMKARAHLMKDLGTVMSPMNAFMILQSTESLSLRVNQHCENALEIAKFLKNHEAVSWVNYPGLEDNENHEMAEKYLNGNYGCIVGFGIKGGIEEGKKLGINIHETGTVVVINGPRFSTKAESKFFTNQGWQVINMSAFPEAYLVKELDMCPLNISLITDYDAGLVGDVPPVSHHAVIEVFNNNVQNLKSLLFNMIENIPSERKNCECALTKQHSQL